MNNPSPSFSGSIQIDDGEALPPPPPPRRRIPRGLFWLLLLGVVVGGIFAAPGAKRAFSRWSQERQLNRARQSFDKGDFERAMLDARAILESNAGNTEANRLIARALEASGGPGALGWRMRLQTLLPDDVENSLSLAKNAVKAGEIALAAQTLENLKSDESANALFHEVSARLAMIRGDAKSAETHWREASRLAPQVEGYQMELAALRIESKDAEVRTAATAALRELANSPGEGIRALRMLVAHARKYQQPARVRELVDELVAAPGVTFADHLTRLAVLRGYDTPDSSSYLDELRAMALPSPEDFYGLLAWMNRNDLATLAAEWLATVPGDMLSRPPVCVGAAQTFAKAAQWEKLREMTEHGGLWGDMDFLRRAFLARALERLGEPEPGASEWKQAVSAAQGRVDAPERMARLALAAGTWRWEQRQEELLWRIARSGRSPRWVLDSLWRIATSRMHTAQMHEVASYIAKAAPGEVTARNNYTFLSLLVRTQEGNPLQESEVLYRANPENPEVALSHAISLYQQGKMEQAIGTTSAFKPADLRKPEASFPFYHAVFLIASDRGAEAEEFLKIAGKRALLPEETAILEREKEFAQKRAELAREQALKENKGAAAETPR